MLEVPGLPVLVAAGAVAVAHTALGPDHYLPFLMLARARGWSRARMLSVTLACGAAHVISSALLGVVGLAIGAGVGWVQQAEGVRADWAAWMLVAFGVAYLLWGLRIAFRRRRGLTPHAHGGHVHIHAGGGHAHGHTAGGRDHPSTFWALFMVFALGPCEPLLPLFVVPASRGDWGLAVATGGVFGVFTLISMAALVLIGHAGVARLPLAPFERWSHAAAGAVVTASGLAILVLGL